MRISPCERRERRWVPPLALGLCLLLAGAPALRAETFTVKALKFAGNLVLGEIASALAGKGFNWARAQLQSQELKAAMPPLVAAISRATGPKRAMLQENLEAHREQLALLEQLSSAQSVQKAKLAELQARQERLLRRVDSLESRMTALERRVDRLDSRVDEIDRRLQQVEDALIRECLDLRYASVLGVDEYRVKESTGGWGDDHFESDELTLDARLLLNSCSADLTRRGLLLQLSLVTRDLDRDLRLYVNWKGVGGTGPVRILDRQEVPLAQPEYRVDGQVVEMFFPYAEIPGFGSTERLALALVLTHDGTVLYTLPDRVISCVFGQRVQCRWGR